jgi:peptidoglycan-associated lipoprotein
MRVKFLAAAAALFLLAACESGTTNSGGITGTGGAPVLANPPPGGIGQGGVGQGGLAGARTAASMQEELQRSVGDRIFFGSDRSDISPEARRTVEGWAGWLRQNPSVTATIEGHADERGTREYNLALGERRAAAARNALIAMGIEPRRLATVSYGKERPQVLGSTEQSWAQNRRGVLLVN